MAKKLDEPIMLPRARTLRLEDTMGNSICSYGFHRNLWPISYRESGPVRIEISWGDGSYLEGTVVGFNESCYHVEMAALSFLIPREVKD